MSIKDFSRCELEKEIERRDSLLNKVMIDKIEPYEKSKFDIDGLFEMFEQHLNILIEDVIDTNARSLHEIDDGSIEFKEDLYHFILYQIYGAERFYDYIDKVCDTLKEKEK